ARRVASRNEARAEPEREAMHGRHQGMAEDRDARRFRVRRPGRSKEKGRFGRAEAAGMISQTTNRECYKLCERDCRRACAMPSQVSSHGAAWRKSPVRHDLFAPTG